MEARYDSKLDVQAFGCKMCRDRGYRKICMVFCCNDVSVCMSSVTASPLVGFL